MRTSQSKFIIHQKGKKYRINERMKSNK